MFVGLVLRHVQDVQKVMRSHLQRLVPGDVPLAEATAMWEAFDAIERQAGAAKTLLAARVEESRAWARAGDRSVEEHLARKAGTSRGAARGGLETSKRLRGLPATEAALRRGELSQAQAETITDAAAVNPSAERSLLDTARTSTLVELRERVRRAKAAGDPDPDATHRRVHRQRRLRRFTDGEGVWSLYGRGTPDAGAIFNATLDPIIDEMFGVARREGRHESRDAYAFDALIELARRARGVTPTSAAPGAAAPASPGANAGTRAGDPCDAAETTLRSVGTDISDRPGPGDGGDGVSPARRTAGPNPSFLALLRVDVEAMARGGVAGDELCEIAGVGPVPARVARGLLGDAVLKLVITRGVDVVNVTHLGRGPSAAQSVALLWSSPGCTNSECDHTLAIQHDHRAPWDEVHETTLANLDRLCPQPCHHRKTHEGWALVEGTGRRPLVPPDHPRHPDNTGHTGASPPAAGASPDATTRPEPPEPTLFDTDAA